MKEYICNDCGLEFVSCAKNETEAECPECYTMNCTEIYNDDETTVKDKWPIVDINKSIAEDNRLELVFKNGAHFGLFINASSKDFTTRFCMIIYQLLKKVKEQS